MHGENLKLIDI